MVIPEGFLPIGFTSPNLLPYQNVVSYIHNLSMDNYMDRTTVTTRTTTEAELI
ncbi:hypothetical protein H6G97_00915 [Nostoc flagelliforme FACHB-838]|uniref:Uncharacterized protein n=1 Tax=Nostoc flagelliforme FACHB-838 TaxID=2692904 RepID=A0ABR8DHI6_9NOSO|nr:hypothetical protein [Nostoc flagelliforme FACHB-838]